MTAAWRDYQDEACDFFRSVGLDAQTDVTLKGVRTTHDVDVVVRGQYVGFSVLWIVECKHWKTSITKLHVLALREIVSDLGADRGILLAESGFQSGAAEAAHLTNVQLTSLGELREPAQVQVYAQRVMELYDRVQASRERYWALSKRVRIEFGLRPDSMEFGYAGDQMIAMADDLLKKAMRGLYPVESDELNQMVHNAPASFASVRPLYAYVESIVDDLDSRLKVAEAAVAKRAVP